MNKEHEYKLEEGPVKPLAPIIPNSIESRGEHDEVQKHTDGTDAGRDEGDTPASR